MYPAAGETADTQPPRRPRDAIADAQGYTAGTSGATLGDVLRGKLEGLAPVAEIERAQELLPVGREAFPLELLARGGLHLREGQA